MVVAGFQGISTEGDITTHGRGGSDTTAVARACGIGADIVRDLFRRREAFTQPTRAYAPAPETQPYFIRRYAELSSGGAGVLQSRAVEFARKYHVVIHSRSAFSDAEERLSRRLFLPWNRQ